jgi:hypothetical protein
MNLAAAGVAGVAVIVLSCSTRQQSPPPTERAGMAGSGGCAFVDATREAGIDWRHTNGSHGGMLFPEIHGSGVAWIDYDNDGWQDLLFLQGRHFPGHIPPAESTMVLYRNDRHGHFVDVTRAAGLDIPMYGMGVAVGDYDNDGWDDLYITTFGHNHLFHNDHGRFTDVSERAHVLDEGEFSSSAMWIDYDNDGFLDLYSLNYVDWTEKTDVWCSDDGKNKTYCQPEVYRGRPNRLFHNNRNGTFTDVTLTSGIYATTGRSFGAVMTDINNDGWTDIIVSNDGTPNYLFMNDHGRFREEGVLAGIAYDQDGRAHAGMGIDAGDLDGDGLETIVIGNFSGEMDWVFKNTGKGTFVDQAPATGIGTVSIPYLTFGICIFDYDLDGWLDVYTANGHVFPDVETVQRSISFRQPSLLFHNRGDGKFDDVTSRFDEPMTRHILGRGAAVCDYDNDGDQDLVVTNNNGPPILMRNDRANGNHFLRVKLRGTTSNRDGIGARLWATVGNRTLARMMRSGSSYLSSNELAVTFGLGSATKVDQLVIKWNCGTVDTLRDLPADSRIIVAEGSGAAEPWQAGQ